MGSLYFVIVVTVIAGFVWCILPVSEKIAPVEAKRQKVDAAMAYKRPYAPESYAAYQVRVDGHWVNCSRQTWHALEEGRTYHFTIHNNRITQYKIVPNK